METNTKFRVRNTFIDYDDKEKRDLGWPAEGSGLRRASSDSALYDTCANDQNSGDDVLDEQVDFDLAGLSDAETDTDEKPPLLCYSHIREGEEELQPDASASCGAAFAPSDYGALARDANSEAGVVVPKPVIVEPMQRSKATATAVDRRKPEAKASTAKVESRPHRETVVEMDASPQVDVERLMSENERLVLENQLLRENMRLTLENMRLAEAAEASSLRKNRSVAERAVEQPVRPQRHLVTCSPNVYMPAAQMMPPLAAGPVPLRMHAKPIVTTAARHEETRISSKGNSDDCCNKTVSKHNFLAAEDSMECELPEAERTTVMLRNLPNNYSRAMLFDLLDSKGFTGQYDFLYLPIDFKSRACLGYAFINLLSPAVVPVFWKVFHGYSRWILPSKKVSSVSWSGPHQGFEAHVSRYRNSPVMHESVPDEYKPVIFCNGTRMCFPPPTKSPRAPRVRNHPTGKGSSKAGNR